MAMKRSTKPADTKKKRAEQPKPKPPAEAKPPAAEAPSAKPAPRDPREARDAADARWRAAEERLALRLAVLEDVVRRANVDLSRRVAELEKRRAGAAA